MAVMVVPVIDDPAGLTPEWLTATFRANGHPATVRGVRYEQIGTGQIGASYRLYLDLLPGAPSEVPSTLVAKLAAGSVAARARVKEGYRKEVRFYLDFAERLAVSTPKCWYAAISQDLQSFTLLLQDLAPAVPGRQAAGCTVAQAIDAVTNLAGLHAPFWCDPVLADYAGWLSPMDAASGAFLGDLMVGATEGFVERYADVLAVEDAETLRGAAALTGKWAAAQSDVFALMHGDYRLDNLMFPPTGPGVAALDWQTATVGPPVRDLAYFLGTSLTVEDRRLYESEVVLAYVAALQEQGVEHRIERCFEDYRSGMLQGPLITVLGCMYATAERSAAADEMFLAMARRSCAAIRDLASLDAVARW